MVEIIKIIKGRQPVDPHEPENVVRMLDNSLEALRREAEAIHQPQSDPRFKTIEEKKYRVRHPRG